MALAMVYVLSGVAALGVVILGVHYLLPISMLGVPKEWTTPVVVAWIALVSAVAWGLFRFSDRIQYTMRTSGGRDMTRRLAEEAMADTRLRCRECGAFAEPDTVRCETCGSCDLFRVAHAAKPDSPPAA
jgi:hypothetical protein